MRLTRLCTLACFVLLSVVVSAQGQPCQPPNPCGQLGVTASTEFKANTSGLDANGITIKDNDDHPFTQDQGVLFAEKEGGSAANSPRITAVALGGVVAKVGDFSLEGKATVIGAGVYREHGTLLNGAPTVGIVGGSGASETELSATVTDFVSVNTISAPVGKRLLVRALLKISGGFTGTATNYKFKPFPGPPNIPTPPDSGGSINGFAGVTASKGAFFSEPYDIASLGPVVEVSSISKGFGINGLVIDSYTPPPRSIAWNFIAPNRQAEAMGYGFHLIMQAMADAATTAGVTGDFHGSIHWGGIVAVEDADTGEVFTDWTVNSQSGFDYSRSFEEQVPEPATLWFAAIGGTALIAQRRSSQRLRDKKAQPRQPANPSAVELGSGIASVATYG